MGSKTVPPPLNIDESMFEVSGLELFNRVRERMGWTDQYLKSINDAQHPLLKDIDQMVTALEILRSTNKEITIVPDFDTDGICAGMILYAGLNEIGLTANLHVPDYHLGHEIQPQVINMVTQQFPNTAAVITCDAGTNSTGALTRANEYELLTLVTDHHVEETQSLAHVIVNPNRLSETYPNKEVREPQNRKDFSLSNRCLIVDNGSVRKTRKWEEKWHSKSTLQSLSACSNTHSIARSTSCGSTSTACPISSWRMCSRCVTRTSLSRRGRCANQRGESRSGVLRRRLERRVEPSLKLSSKSKSKARVRRWSCESQTERGNELPVTVMVTGSSLFPLTSSL